MITLSNLIKLANEKYPNEPVNIVTVLRIWTMENPENELKLWLSGTGMSLTDMFICLEDLVLSREDQHWLTQIISKKSRQTKGKELLLD